MMDPDPISDAANANIVSQAYDNAVPGIDVTNFWPLTDLSNTDLLLFAMRASIMRHLDPLSELTQDHLQSTWHIRAAGGPEVTSNDSNN